MRAIVQRVTSASVKVEDILIGEIGNGLLIFLGIENSDNIDDIEWLSKKISRLRIFGDEKGAMNKSIIDIDGNVLVVSQFTLYASTKRGNRPPEYPLCLSLTDSPPRPHERWNGECRFKEIGVQRPYERTWFPRPCPYSH